MRVRAAIGLAATVAVFGAAIAAAVTPVPGITGKGVGAVTLGASYKKLHRKGVIGKIRPGCELGGPRTRSAPLKAGVKGTVEFTLKDPRRVRSISIRGGSGATARGVGIGATIPEIKAAFPTATEEHGTDEVFLLTLVRVPKSDGGKITFGVSTTTGKVMVIGVPYIAFCE
jgi:hypothetical protein